jgi:hypothetical protein
MSTTPTPPYTPDMPNMPDIPNMPANEQDCQQDTLRRINYWLGILEQRIQTLLRHNDPETMKPGEREQAISRHLMLTMRLLSLRQQYAKARASAEEQALMDALMQGLEEG